MKTFLKIHKTISVVISIIFILIIFIDIFIFKFKDGSITLLLFMLVQILGTICLLFIKEKITWVKILLFIMNILSLFFIIIFFFFILLMVIFGLGDINLSI